MKKNRMYLVVAGVVAAVMLTGCGGGKNNQNVSVPDSSGKSAYHTESMSDQETNSSIPDASSPDTSTADFNQLYETANLNGKVIEFTDSGFLANQVVESGDTAEIAVGGENTGMRQSPYSIRKIRFFKKQPSVHSQSLVSSLTDGDRSEIKKESQVLVYGAYESSGVLKADKVIRLVWE